MGHRSGKILKDIHIGMIRILASMKDNEIGRKSARSISIRTERTFAASHILENMGKCANLHGHNWRVEIEIAADPRVLKSDGIVVDFSHLKAVVDKYDHKHLNDYIKIPTAENIAMRIIDDITSFIMFADSIVVTVWESDTSCAIASEIF